MEETFKNTCFDQMKGVCKALKEEINGMEWIYWIYFKWINASVLQLFLLLHMEALNINPSLKFYSIYSKWCPAKYMTDNRSW